MASKSHCRRGGSPRGRWSELLPEVLHLISKKLPDLPDLVRFRAVCHHWRSSASPSDLRPQLPWFVRDLDFIDYTEDKDPQKYLWLYNMYSGSILNIKVPQSPSMELMGSAHRYMLAFNCYQSQSSLSLLNPLTGRQIALPPLNLDWCELVCIRSDSRGSGDAVTVYGRLEGLQKLILGCCRVGDRNWMTVEQSNTSASCRTYHDGMFYVHDQKTRVTEVVNPATGAVVHSIPPQEYAVTKPVNAEWCFDFFVESCGDLLGISSIYGKGLLDNNPKKCSFEIHYLDDRNGSPRWIQMKSIGDRFLFLHGSSGVSCNASDFPGFQRNSIYFLGSTMQKMNAIVVSSYLVFDIEKGMTKRLQCPGDVETWFLPGLH